MDLASWVHLRRALLTVVVTLAFWGCEAPSATGPDRELNPSNFTNGPPSPGMIIVRVEGALSRVLTDDPERGLLAIHGVVSGFSECNDTTTRVLVDTQIVLTPSDAHAISLFLTGKENDVGIYAGSLADLFPFTVDKVCEFIATNSPLFGGQVQYRLHINGQGSLRFIWEGFVNGTEGGAQYHYLERQYLVVRGNGTMEQVGDDIFLRPVGG
jgi:hypothetical protein